MPYIKKEDCKIPDETIGTLVPLTVGDLNYCITMLCNNYLKDKGLRYKHINDIIGVLECAKMELYRRVGAIYEDECIWKNGDCFPIELIKPDPK